MGRKLIIFCSVSLLLLSCGQVKNDKSKHNENWALFEELETMNQSWIPVGNAPATKSGNYTLFYFNGNVYEKGKMVGGKHVDTAFYFDRNGERYGFKVMESETATVYFYKDGDYTTYYSDGSISGKGNIKNNHIGDKWISYYKNGTKSLIVELQNGAGYIVEYYANGNKKSQKFVNKDANLNFFVKNWHENGNLSFNAEIKNEKYSGLLESYYPNGQVKKRWEMRDNVYHGLSTEYYDNGQISASENQIDGLTQGKVMKWYKDGTVKAIVYCKDDEFDGLQKIYHENGRLKLEFGMMKGKFNGPRLEYDTLGNLVASKMYRDGILAN